MIFSCIDRPYGVYFVCFMMMRSNSSCAGIFWWVGRFRRDAPKPCIETPVPFSARRRGRTKRSRWLLVCPLEGGREVDVTEADAYETGPVVAVDRHFGRVELHEPEGRQSRGCESADFQLSVPFHLEAHRLLHLARKRVTRRIRIAQSATETIWSATAHLLPVDLDDADADLEDLLSHGTSLERTGRVERPHQR